MKAHWTTSASADDDPEIRDFMNRTAKIVFSKSLNHVDWNNSEVINENSREEVEKLKNQPGKNILLLGSGYIVSQLTDLGLIDEYRFLVNPVALSSGKTLFDSAGNKIKLKTVNTKLFENGNVLLCYQPE